MPDVIDREYYEMYGTIGTVYLNTSLEFQRECALDKEYVQRLKQERLRKRKALQYKGKRIVDIYFDCDELRLKFSNDSWLSFSDKGQSCCESRSLTVDGDNLREWVGATFWGARLGESTSDNDDYNVHEIQFLRISTDCGPIVVSAHNRHNGYYGGFTITFSIEEP